MPKRESYHQRAGRIGKELLSGARNALGDITDDVERLQKWTGDADELAEIADQLKLKALQLGEETEIAANKKLENRDHLEQVVQKAATLATLFHNETARYVLSEDVEGYYEFSKFIESDSRVAAWRRLPDIELQRIHRDWQRAVRTKVRE